MSFDKTKTDPKLGKKIREYLISKGVETPIVDSALEIENIIRINF